MPEDYALTCRELLGSIQGELSTHSQKALQSNWVDEKNKKVFNNKQISDHFAIIPTTSSPSNLDANEWKIYNLIAKRFISVFYPPAQWDVTTRTSALGTHKFRTEGRVLVEPSWLAIYGKDNQPDDALPLSHPKMEMKPTLRRLTWNVKKQSHQHAIRKQPFFQQWKVPANMWRMRI